VNGRNNLLGLLFGRCDAFDDRPDPRMNGSKTYFGGALILYKDIFDRSPDLSELLSVIRDLDRVQASMLLCQISAEVRLAKRDKEAIGKTQRDLAGVFFDDQTIDLLKQRFGTIHSADRVLFHPPQILSVLRLVIQHSVGGREPSTDDAAKWQLGTACLMMNDMLLTKEEAAQVSTGAEESKMRALMTQMLGPFEVMNTAAITHVLYRSRIMFHILLGQKRVIRRIQKQCRAFSFKQEFLRAVGIPLSRWLFILLAYYFYLTEYVEKNGGRDLRYLAIDRAKFGAESRITQKNMGAVLKTVSTTLANFKLELEATRPTDWRFDFVPFKSKPFIELVHDKFFCSDLGFLVDKIHSGVYWAINPALDRADRHKLFNAWGVLFEEYVNWFFKQMRVKKPLLFFPFPKWWDGTESFDGALMQDRRFVPMEYKGGFLKIEARYSGNTDSFEKDLDLKIGEGCKQLAWKIGRLFSASPRHRKKLRDVPLDHVTRVVPVLVVQDYMLRGPFVNWWLNKRFNALLDKSRLRHDVTVDSLNLVGIHELETMVESASAGSFDIIRALQLRCFADPEMRSELHNFLMAVPGYGEGKSEKIVKILNDQWAEMADYLFGKERTKSCPV
jgi:hypothetical protein